MVENLTFSFGFLCFCFVLYFGYSLAKRWFIFGFWNFNEIETSVKCGKCLQILSIRLKENKRNNFWYSFSFSFFHSLIQSRRSKKWLRLFFLLIQFFMNHRYRREYACTVLMNDESVFCCCCCCWLIWCTKYKLFNEPNI